MRRAAFLAALTGMAMPASAVVDRFVTLEEGGEAQLGTLGQEQSPLTGWPDIGSATIDGAGRVWLSQSAPASTDDRVVFRPEAPDAVGVLADVSFIPAKRRRGPSGCWIGRGRDLELLVNSNNGSGASTAISRLDTDRGIAGYLHGGLTGPSLPTGRFWSASASTTDWVAATSAFASGACRPPGGCDQRGDTHDGSMAIGSPSGPSRPSRPRGASRSSGDSGTEETRSGSAARCLTLPGSPGGRASSRPVRPGR